MTDRIDFTRWEEEIRDPTEKASEKTRTLDTGGARASYRIAQLPSGEWAIQISCTLDQNAGTVIPWRRFPTREETVASFVAQARAFFERTEPKKHQRDCHRKILVLLSPGLFGFVEPEPPNA